MRIQLAWTMLTELLVIVSGIVLLKLAASLLGLVGFGEYTLSRRAIALLYLPLVMGLGIAAPRYIAIVRAGALESYSESGFVTATLFAGLLPSLIVVVLLNVSPDLGATLIFGTSTLSHLVRPATIALAGIAVHSMVYAIYRGRSETAIANAMQLINLGVVPLAAFAYSAPSAAAVVTVTGSAWLLVSGIALIHVVVRERGNWRGASSLKDHLRMLLRFGLPRVPGEFALIGIFAIPALIAVRAHGIAVAGQFSAALSLLTIAAAAFAPAGQIILPRASAQVATGDIAGVRRLVMKILGGGILLAAVGVAVGELAIPSLVTWYFGPAFAPAIPVFRACLLGAIPYIVYVLMRNILDALDVKAVNSRNLIITLILVTALCLINSDIMWMSFSLVGCLSLLGLLTLRDTYGRLRTSASVQTLAVPA